jgi:hypothetical protein
MVVLLISVLLVLAIPMQPQSSVVNILPSSLAARDQQRVEQHARDLLALERVCIRLLYNVHGCLCRTNLSMQGI